MMVFIHSFLVQEKEIYIIIVYSFKLFTYFDIISMVLLVQYREDIDPLRMM